MRGVADAGGKPAHIDLVRLDGPSDRGLLQAGAAHEELAASSPQRRCTRIALGEAALALLIDLGEHAVQLMDSFDVRPV